MTADPMALSAAWRQKQLEYTWRRALMGRYEDFWAVTEAALRYALRRLAKLAPRPRAILSNGSPRMLQAAVRSSGLEPYLGHRLVPDLGRADGDRDRGRPSHSPFCCRSLATSAVQPVWWLAPMPAPLSPWKYS